MSSYFAFSLPGAPTEHQPVLEEMHGWNEVSNATQPWCQQNHDKYREKTVNKMENDGEQTKK